MKYTTRQFRVDGSRRHLEIFEDMDYAELYGKLIDLWIQYTDFSKVPFPLEPRYTHGWKVSSKDAETLKNGVIW